MALLLLQCINTCYNEPSITKVIMLLNELFEEKRSGKILLENVTLGRDVSTIAALKDPKTKAYYTGVVDVTGDVNLINRKPKLLKLPVQFGKVDGHFRCNGNALTSLEGVPREVGGGFVCSDNHLTSLAGAPQVVEFFHCGFNQLTSLEGAPSEVTGSFDCQSNRLTSLKGIHKIVKRIDGSFNCFKNPIKTGGIGLILIEGLTKIISGDQPAFKIINKYLGQGKKGLLLCQDELIEAKLEKFAEL